MTVQHGMTYLCNWRTAFPLYFCETRWIEDKFVAECLLEIWPNVTKFVDYYDGLPASKQPSYKSHMKIKNAVSDDLTIAKLHYLSHIAGLLQQFLILYQTDQPMHPFLLDDLKVLINKYYQSTCTWEIKNSERVTWYKAGWKKPPWKQKISILALQLPMKFKSNYKITLWPLNKFVTWVRARNFCYCYFKEN